MLSWLIRNRIDAFERKLGYDMTYVREMLATDRKALMKFMKATQLGTYMRDIPRDVHWGVKLVSIVHEDCGPCTQLGVTLALAEGVDARLIEALLSGDLAAVPEPVALGVRFANAVLAHAAEADEAREEIERRWGKRAVLSLAFAITTAKIYPTVKYALGHGKACQRITVAGTQVTVVREAVEPARGVAGGAQAPAAHVAAGARA
jgi:hypothetical protein